MLRLTYQDLTDILNEEFNRFEILYHDLPEGIPSDYMEDDGRMYMWVEFKDHETNLTYEFQYIYHSEYQDSFPLCFLIEPKGIEWIEVSEINPPQPAKIKSIPLTPEQQADKELMEIYNSITDKKDFKNIKSIGLTKNDIVDIVEFMNRKEGYNIFQLREKIIPICIEKKIHSKGFWDYLVKQSRSYKNKRNK